MGKDNGKNRTPITKWRKHVGQPLETEMLLLISLCVLLFLLVPRQAPHFTALLGLMTGSYQCGTLPLMQSKPGLLSRSASLLILQLNEGRMKS